MEISREITAKYKTNDTILLPEIGDFVKKIDNSKNKNIILVGPRSSGKTTIMLNYKRKHQLEGDIVILPNFNKLSNLLMTKQEKMLEIELILCEELVKYIINDKLLEFYNVMIGNLKKDLYDQCMTRVYMPSDDRNIDIGVLLQNILSEVKKETNKNNIILIIDRFDWIKNSSKIFQNILVSFFAFFSRNIIISEDDTILTPSRIEELKNNKFDIVNLNYTKEVVTIKKIIILKLKMYKCISMNAKKLLDDKNIEYLILSSDGNLDILFYVIEEVNKVSVQLTDKELIEFIDNIVYSKKKISNIIPKKKLQI